MRSLASMRAWMQVLGAAALGLLLSCSGGGGGKSQPPSTPAPTITSIAPTSGPAGTPVTISGSHLDSVTAVTFGGTAAVIGTQSAAQLTTAVPNGASTGTIAVTGPGGTAISSTTFTIVPDAPTITSFSPTSGTAGTAVSIMGTNLDSSTAVAFSGAAAVIGIHSATQLATMVPVGAVTGPITVTGPGGTAISSAAFTIVPDATPTITGFNPTSGAVGASVVITGTNLTGASSVKFNGVSTAIYSVDNATQITATVPASASTGPISVVTPAGAATSATNFTVASGGGTPTISGFSIGSALPGEAVAINGTNFGGATSVKFNGTAALFIQESSSQITALVPTGATNGTVTVTTPGGTATSPSAFTVASYPTSLQSNNTFTAIPDAPSSSVNGTPVLIPFTVSGMAYPVKDVQLSIYITHTYVGDLDLQLIAPDSTSVSLEVSRNDPGANYGTGCGAGQYTVFSDSGAGPLSGSAPYVGTFKPSQPLSTLAGKNANGTWNLRIQDQGPADTGNFVCGTLLVTGGPTPPTITGFNPTMGPATTTVLLTGTHLSGATLVTQGSFSAGALSNVTDTSLTFTLPTGAPTAPAAPLRVVTPGGTAISSRAFTPTTGGTTGDLFIDGAYVTQSAQNYAGNVPLVAGKDGVLRVFVRGNQGGITGPNVRVRVYNGATLTGTQTLFPPVSNAPTSVNEGSLSSSWNYSMPGASIQPGLRLLVDVDPANAIAEADETNNAWPSSGTPMAMDVRSLQTFHGTLIPVTQSGLTGNANSSNLASWYAKFQKMYPIAPNMDVLLGAPYTTSQVLVSGGGGWSALLGELEAKRVVEASTRYYYGALNVSYGSGVAGLGYVPSSGSSAYRSAMGWDKTTGYADGGLYYDVLTHETGHNLGRQHSPCGGAGSPDPAYPYPGALIGIWGLDVAAGILKDPSVFTDIMAYCTPVWVSDYVYSSILSFRQASPFGIAPPAGSAIQADTSPVQDCLLISGRIRNGMAELDPALQVSTIPTGLSGKPFHGSRIIQGFDASGTLLFSRAVSLAQVADDIPGEHLQHFIAAFPMKDLNANGLRELRVMGDFGTEAVRWSSNALPLRSGAAQLPQARSIGEGEMRLTWDVSAHPLMMVRDAKTGEVLSFARGGDMILATRATVLELTLSDGVASEKMLVNPVE